MPTWTKSTISRRPGRVGGDDDRTFTRTAHRRCLEGQHQVGAVAALIQEVEAAAQAADENATKVREQALDPAVVRLAPGLATR
jgi:hypothetical protein